MQSFVLNKNRHCFIKIISGAFRRKYKGAGSDKEAEANIGHTLKHAPHRPGGVKIRREQVRPTSPLFVVVQFLKGHCCFEITPKERISNPNF